MVEKIKSTKGQGKTIGFVPTMGCLHEGHLSLIRKARKDTDCVVVSIFVNPIQFGPSEDLRQYPRDLRRDLKLCRRNGADIVFFPTAKMMYPDRFSTYVNVKGFTGSLCGASRRGHFRGVTTVVAKLFNIVSPDIAYFGQKDAQQAIIIKKMVEDLNIPAKIKVLSIVREKDGLAMSSRNTYLSPLQRRQALSLYKALKLAQALHRKGERDSNKIIKGMRSLIRKERDARIDYISIVDTKRLKDLNRISEVALVAVAVRIGRIRLIDNMILNYPPSPRKNFHSR